MLEIAVGRVAVAQVFNRKREAQEIYRDLFFLWLERSVL
ncbi:hypothetical protein JCM19240_5858 [Vibrio maritimus]|uniref:Uncharacterized protein n=1 Tax=Vibrio maritimus TaxID=990268 RepID=A0A090TME4_9VIBR|nr:hypothetical protein JCM19240_5858 [Vibrio maritimus]